MPSGGSDIIWLDLPAFNRGRPDWRGALRKYTVEVAKWLWGDGPQTHLPQQPSPYPIPVYLAALTSQNVELAGEIADGVMPLWWSVERVKRHQARLELVGGDFFEAVPAGGDLYLPKFVLHDWNDERSGEILNNIRQIIAPSGRLVVVAANE
jgi:hypothetical protein